MSQVAAVIQISEFNESPQLAIKSVLQHSAPFACVVLVKLNCTTDTVPYDGFDMDKQALKEKGIAVFWQSKLDVTKLPANVRAIVRMEPDVIATEAAINALIEDMTDYTYNYYAIATTLNIEHSKTRDPRVWFQSLSYGFLLVVLVMDTLRSWFSLFRYNRTVDMRGQKLQITFPNRISLASEHWYMWWIGTGICQTRNGGTSAQQMPAEKDQGIGFTLRTIKYHKQMTWGLWWPIFFALYYCAFAWPWYNYYLSPHSLLGKWLIRDMSQWYWQSLYLAHTALVGLLAWLEIKLPKTYVPMVGDQSLLLPMQVLLYTVYLTLSPLIFVYAKLHVSRASWQNAADVYKRPAAAPPAALAAGAVGEKEE